MEGGQRINMKLKCKINEEIYENVVQGESFAEEFNETLDSGSLIITHVNTIGLKPHNDVFIWNSDYDFQGFYEDKIIMNGVEYTFDEEDMKFKNEAGESVFYKHLLIDTFSEDMINLKNLNLSEEEYIKNGEKGVGSYKPIYEYKIQLMSETKGLEVIPLPNTGITQPLNTQ